MNNKAICGSCHSPANCYGKARKNEKGQFLVNIRPHMRADGMACFARIGVTTSKEKDGMK